MFSGFTLKTESREKLFSKQMSVLYMVHFRVYGDYLTLQGQMLSLFHNTLSCTASHLKTESRTNRFYPTYNLQNGTQILERIPCPSPIQA